MSTYSLTLREEKGSKLTIQELDNNFRYLDSKESGTQGPQGPQGPQGSGSGGGGSIDIISMTISHEMLAMSYLEPVEVIPAPGVGKMTIPIWGRYRKINGTTDWFGPYFQVYPDGFGPINGGGGNYFNGSLFGSTSIKDKFYLLKPGSGADFADYYPDNTSWKLSLSNAYIYYTINLKSVITPFISGDVIVDLNSGVTASILIANPYNSKDSTQVLIVPDITGFSTNDLVSGTGGASPSGSATIASTETPPSQGDYDMELYIGYQTLGLII